MATFLRISFLSLLASLSVMPGCYGEIDKEGKAEATLTRLINEKEYDKAIEVTTEILKIVPEKQGLRVYRGIAWLEKKEFDIAMRDFNEIIRLLPEDADKSVFLYFRGRCLAGNENHAAAIDDYNMALSTNPSDARTWMARGLSWAANGNADKAESDFAEALELDSSLFADAKK